MSRGTIGEYSQEAAILAALRAGEELTPLAALQRFGCLRLGARIHDLRRAGYAITARTERRGRKHWAAYRMEADNTQTCET